MDLDRLGESLVLPLELVQDRAEPPLKVLAQSAVVLLLQGKLCRARLARRRRRCERKDLEDAATLRGRVRKLAWRCAHQLKYAVEELSALILQCCKGRTEEVRTSCPDRARVGRWVKDERGLAK